MKRHRVLVVVSLLPVAAATGFAACIAWLGYDSDRPSQCAGTVRYGSLTEGRRLPYAGENYRAYSLLGFLFGRTFVHSAVRDAMREAYAELRQSHPELRFVYAEGGWPWGGRFAPHRTHANGTAVDFQVPVRTLDGRVSELPTSLLNLFGYAIRFDATGRAGAHMLDFDAMGAHLLALDRAARKRGIPIRRVIFNAGLQPKLAATEPGSLALRRLPFNKGRAWVPHDEHYHVEFDVPCR
jgi:penicillin-insensitive murein endopeptidase